MSFEHKVSIFESYTELTKTQGTQRRVNFVYSDSKKSGKVLATQLAPSGNGYVCGRYMGENRTDRRGWIKIKDYTDDELREVIGKAIDSMSR